MPDSQAKTRARQTTYLAKRMGICINWRFLHFHRLKILLSSSIQLSGAKEPLPEIKYNRMVLFASFVEPLPQNTCELLPGAVSNNTGVCMQTNVRGRRVPVPCVRFASSNMRVYA